MTELQFESGSFFLLMVLTVVGAVVTLFWLRRYARHLLSLPVFFLRLITLLVVLAAAAEPFTVTTTESSRAMLLLDISESMDEVVVERLLKNVRDLASKDIDISLLPFAGIPGAVESDLDDVGSYPRFRKSWSKLNVGETNLETALQSILGRADASILLLSDGQETQGSIERLRSFLLQSSSKIFPFVPAGGVEEQDQFRLSHLHAPLVAPAQKSVEVRTSIKNSTANPQKGQLRLTHDGKPVLEESITVDPGQELLVLSESDPSTEGIKEIVAELKPDNPALSPTVLTTYLSGAEREKVLLVNGTAEDERLFKKALLEQSYRLVSHVAGASRVETPALSSFSVVIFNNVSVKQLESGTLRKLDQYVKQGGSFIMIGGNRSFGLGGYIGTRMENILPVRMIPPQTEKKRLNVAVALVLDKSRSMAFGNKIEYAKDAAREVVRNLKDDDYIGVIGFDTTPFIAVPIMQLRTNRERAMSRVGRLFPAGKTNLFPALDEARRNLMKVKAGRKHMIVLTDGKIPDAGPYYIELVRQMRMEGITVSTVMMGREADVAMLREMADVGRGSFYQTSNAQNLPRIFLSDIHASTGERTLREKQEYVVKGGREGIRSTTIRRFPPLTGFVQTAPKRNADLELITLDLGKAYPLFANWEYGEGRSVAFTSDANGRWSTYWARWPGFQRFWTEVIDSIRPRKDDFLEELPFQLRHYVSRGALHLDLSVFSEKAQGEVQATLTLPDGSQRLMNFSPTSYGRFSSVLENGMAGKHELRVQIGSRSLTPVAFSLSGELFGEQRGKGYNVPTLSGLASLSGGKLNPSAEDIRTQVYTSSERHHHAGKFMLLALVLLLAEILYRELFASGGNSIFRRIINRRKSPRQYHGARKARREAA